MKKLYSVALAALCTMSVTAANLQIRDVQNLQNAELQTKAPKKMERSHRIVSMQKVAEIDGTAISTKAKTGDTYTVDGQYVMTIGDYYFGNSVGEVDIDVTIELEDGIYWLMDESGDWFGTDVPAIYNATAGTLTFPYVEIGQAGNYYTFFAPFHYYEVGKEGYMDYLDSYDAKFDAKTGTIIFEPDYGFVWPAYSDPNYTNELGYFGLFDVIGAQQQEGEENPLDEEQAGQWKSVGTAVFTDAWITPAYSTGGVRLNPKDYTYEVELQRNVNNSNLFRLWKPYQTDNFYLRGQNQSKFSGQIVFDISDPDHVHLVAGMPAGFKNSNGDLYIFNLLGWQINGWGDDFDPVTSLPAIYQYMEEKSQPFDTFKDNVVTIVRSVFDIKPACSSAYSWNDNPYETSTIELPEEAGVKGVLTDEDNYVEPVYYNIQGIRVDRAEPGQLVIKKQGNTVTKLVVR